MANYIGRTRTNYFHLKNGKAEKFNEIMERVVCAEDSIEVWEEKDKTGNIVYGFGTMDTILGISSSDYEDEDPNYDSFTKQLQDCVADDDAIMITEVGYEKLRYLTGCVIIITTNDITYLTLENAAIEKTRNLLKNPAWTTRNDF